jgi:2-haloacid dehalogenase
MANLSRNVGLVWDEILSAEDVGVKKPDPKVYWHAVDKLGPPPKQILMVAAHLFDVRAAQDHGFRTAYVQRRDDRDPTDGDAFDFVVADFKELADQLGV